jgi:hypothetical protein
MNINKHFSGLIVMCFEMPNASYTRPLTTNFNIMKYLFIGLFILGWTTQTIGQQSGMTFKDASGIFQDLEERYKSAVHVDTSQAVFPGKGQEVFNAYFKMFKDFAGFLKENKFTWGKPTRCINKIFFSADGTVDYFLFNFNNGEINEDKEIEFKRLLNEFLKDFKFSLSADEKFSQCGPVIYQDE